MSLTILSVAYPLTPVGPNASGGSEQILSILDACLTKMGHRSLVIAVAGSDLQGQLIPSPRATTRELNDEVRRWGQRAHRRLILDTLNRYPVDLLHMHSLDFHTYLPASSIPTLATLHLPMDWYPRQIFQQQRRNFYLNCVSQSQQKTCPEAVSPIPVVRNGIDVRSFQWKTRKKPFVLALGRICPEKGFYFALDAARQAGISMILAGELFDYPEHREYFDKEIVPRLDEQRQFIGPVGAVAKRELLATAKSLLVPSLVAETSSLVTMEALASGTPVIAFRAGAIPELVENGKTGFLVDDAEQMAAAIERVDGLQAVDCRKSAETSCSYQSMVKSYLSLYRRLLTRQNGWQPPAVPAGLSWLAS
ncbi:MAG: glycosyltransferase [Bryobacteraceae bacterium]|nr:glycosyltransferase [Bryobacteraceae bacterium]